jgi:biotin synthase
MAKDEVLAIAAEAREAGADRFCMGAAWRQAKDGPAFDSVLDMVRGVRALGMEACVTLGMLTEDQATRLKQAGLTAYNHNLDTSPEYYGSIITTRTYDDRLRTLAAVRGAGIEMCCGGIIGMGESVRDRAGMLQVLASFDPHPEGVPINGLVAVAGTPLADRTPVDTLGRADGCDCARPDAEVARAALSRPLQARSRRADPVLPCRRELVLLRRETPRYPQRGTGRRPGLARGPRAQAR